jgi:hypothetical protein
MGIRVAVQNHDGVLLASLCASRELVTDSGTAEALAAWQAAELTQMLELRQVVLEGDALEIINIFKLDGAWRGNYGYVIQDAKHILGCCQEWRVNHIYLEGNGVAHSLAKLALSLGQDMLWADGFPVCIRELYLLGKDWINQ